MKLDPAKLRRMADEEDRKAQHHRENMAACEARALLYRKTAEEVERLTGATKPRTLVAMDTHAHEKRRRGRPVVTTHPYPAALASIGESVAGRHGKRRTIVQDWISGRRPIPRQEAEAIRREFPSVTLDAWPRIGD